MSKRSNRKGRRFGKLTFESLEPRVVLNAQFEAGLADALNSPATGADDGTSTAASEVLFQQFASADELQRYLVQDANQRYGDLFGQEVWWWPLPDVLGVGDSDRSRGDYSTTNIQVAGVDEGDLVKTDGQYLYVGVGSEVKIIDVQSAADMRVLARLGSTGQTSALYLSEDRLTVISQATHWYRGPMPLVDADTRHVAWWGGEPKFQVTVYDVSSPKTPLPISHLEIEGHYVDSRMIGQTVYLVSGHSFHLPPPEIVPGRFVSEEDDLGTVLAESGMRDDVAVGMLPRPGTDGSGSPAAYETREQYWRRIGDRVLELALPTYALRDNEGNAVASGLLTSAEATYRPLKGQADQLVSLTAVDVGGDQPGIVASTSVPIGWASTVYVSPHNLYVVTANWSTNQATSEIYKFALHPERGQIPLVATGRVPGQVLNAFSLDEQGNHLRIVTRSGWQATARSDLYVLEHVDERLVPTGQIENLAPGEQLFSVRFMGNQAFVVTFGPQGGVWYDPLFTIDLSDPASPRLIGELEIPGFSNYLQKIEGEYLIGLGRNADEDDGRQLEPQVSLFDVSDFADPQLIDRVSFGSASSWSEAFFNHHAISYFPEQGILAVPLDTWFPAGWPILRAEDDSDGESTIPRWLSQLWVFRVDTGTDPAQVRVLGTIEHDSTILRSLRIGDQLFSISGDVVQTHELADPGVQLGVLYFGRPAVDDWFSVDFGSQNNRLDVLANDHLEPAGDWRIVSVTQPGNGVAWLDAEGRSVLYSPASGFSGRDTFVYSISGPGGVTDEARVTVDVSIAAVQWRMIELARKDLAERLAVPIEEIRIRSVEMVRWPDSCLGIPTAGQACALVITPGFRIGLQHDNTIFVYHTDTGTRVLLARKLSAEPRPTDPEPAEPVVRVRLEAADGLGRAVTTVQAGEAFTLNLYVEDLRVPAAGVYATYADVFYPARLVSVDENPITFGEDYVNGRSGEADRPGLLNDLGAFASFETLGGGERLLASVSFVAYRAGTASFVVTPAGARGYEVLVYGEDEAVADRQVDWQGVELQVIGGWRNIALPTDVNDDGRTTPLDVLVGINAINTHGVLKLDDADLAPTVAGLSGRHFYDVNGDGYLTALDVLHVINRLNSGTENPVVGAGEGGLPARPLASWVDWKSLHEVLQQDRWQQPLQTLHLSPEQTMRLMHEILVTVDADRLDDLLRNRVTFEPSQWKDALAPVLDAIRMHVSVDELLDLADQLQVNFDELDLHPILPGAEPQIDLTAASLVFHDAFFAKLSDPLFLLDLLDS